MGRPIIHGASWLAKRTARNRTSPRARRLMLMLREALDRDPWPTVAALVKERITKRELVMQQRETHLIANPDDDGSNWLIAAWNAQRRDLELLAALLDREPDGDRNSITCARCTARVPVAEYAHHTCPPLPSTADPTVESATAPAVTTAAGATPTEDQ